MALIACDECGKEISSDASTCPHCGKKQRQGFFITSLKVVGAFIVIIILINVFSKQSKDIKPTSEVAKPVVNVSEIKQTIDKFTSVGLIYKVDNSTHAIYVDPSLWSGIEVDLKEKFCRNVAYYFGTILNDDSKWCDIMDRYTGKKIAKYDSWGFKVY